MYCPGPCKEHIDVGIYKNDEGKYYIEIGFHNRSELFDDLNDTETMWSRLKSLFRVEI